MKYIGIIIEENLNWKIHVKDFVSKLNRVRFRTKSIAHSTTLTWNHIQDKLTEYGFLCLTPRILKVLLVNIVQL